MSKKMHKVGFKIRLEYNVTEETKREKLRIDREEDS